MRSPTLDNRGEIQMEQALTAIVSLLFGAMLAYLAGRSGQRKREEQLAEADAQCSAMTLERESTWMSTSSLCGSTA